MINLPFSERREKQRLSQREQEYVERIAERGSITTSLRAMARKKGYANVHFRPGDIASFALQFSEKVIKGAIDAQDYNALVSESSSGVIFQTHKEVQSSNSDSVGIVELVPESFTLPASDIVKDVNLMNALLMTREQYFALMRNRAVVRLDNLVEMKLGRRAKGIVTATLGAVGWLNMRNAVDQDDQLSGAWAGRSGQVTNEGPVELPRKANDFWFNTNKSIFYQGIKVPSKVTASKEQEDVKRFEPSQDRQWQLAAYICGYLNLPCTQDLPGTMKLHLPDEVRVDVVLGNDVYRVVIPNKTLTVEEVYTVLSEQVTSGAAKKYDHDERVQRGYFGVVPDEPTTEPHFLFSIDRYTNPKDAGHANPRQKREYLGTASRVTRAAVQIQVDAAGGVVGIRQGLTHSFTNGVDARTNLDFVQDSVSRFWRASREAGDLLQNMQALQSWEIATPKVDAEQAGQERLHHAPELMFRKEYSRYADSHDLWNIPELFRTTAKSLALPITPTDLMHLALAMYFDGSAQMMRAGQGGTLLPLSGAIDGKKIALQEMNKWSQKFHVDQSHEESTYFKIGGLNQIIDFFRFVNEEKQQGPLSLWLIQLVKAWEDVLKSASNQIDRDAQRIAAEPEVMMSPFGDGMHDEVTGRKLQLIKAKLIKFLRHLPSDQAAELAQYYAQLLYSKPQLLISIFKIASLGIQSSSLKDPDRILQPIILSHESDPQNSQKLEQFRKKLTQDRSFREKTIDLATTAAYHKDTKNIASSLSLPVDFQTLYELAEILFDPSYDLGAVDTTTANAQFYEHASYGVIAFQPLRDSLCFNGRISYDQLLQPAALREIVDRLIRTVSKDGDDAGVNRQVIQDHLQAYFLACNNFDGDHASRQSVADAALANLYVSLNNSEHVPTDDELRTMLQKLLDVIQERWEHGMDQIMNYYRSVHLAMRETSIDEWTDAFKHSGNESATRLGKKQRKEQG